MVDFTEPTVAPSGKKIADHFATVRERGMLNAGMEAFEAAYLENHPNEMLRWERYTPGKDNGTDDVVFREGQGWHLVNAADVGLNTASSAKTGVLRRGDLVLMAIDKKVGESLLAQDAVAASVDAQSPKKAFNDALDARKVRLSDGTEDQARGVGKVTVSEQFVSPAPDRTDS
jgi:hypothetical protein